MEFPKELFPLFPLAPHRQRGGALGAASTAPSDPHLLLLSPPSGVWRMGIRTQPTTPLSPLPYLFHVVGGILEGLAGQMWDPGA